jgi:hypothetical protein
MFVHTRKVYKFRYNIEYSSTIVSNSAYVSSVTHNFIGIQLGSDVHHCVRVFCYSVVIRDNSAHVSKPVEPVVLVFMQRVL